MEKLTLEKALEIGPGDRIVFTPEEKLDSYKIVPGNIYEVERVQLFRISPDSKRCSFESFRTKHDFLNQSNKMPVNEVFYSLKEVGGFYTYKMFSI